MRSPVLILVQFIHVHVLDSHDGHFKAQTESGAPS